MRALITGAFGFAGRHLISHLKECGDEIVGTYLIPESNLPSVENTKLDVTSLEECIKIFRKYSPKVIYHLAGIAFAPDADKDFSLALSVNTGGTYNVFRACADLKLRTKIIVISSSEVYGMVTGKDLPVTETTPWMPTHNYGLSKATTELVARRFQKEVNFVIVRAFNHIGPGQRAEFVVSTFAEQLAKIASKKSSPVIKVGNLDAKRDFTDVRDIVRGYRLAAEKGEGSGVFNLCSGKAVSIQSILDTLIEISGLKVTIEKDPERMRPSELPVLYGSYELAKSKLGWEPKYELKNSLRDVYEYWKGKQ